MNEKSNFFYRYTNWWERDIRGTQIGCYSVAIIGLTIALRKVRPFSKFKRPKDIPNHFITERRELVGTVQRIEPGGGLLMIKHKPLIDLPLVSSGQLPIKISGLRVTGLGINWLQAIVVGNEVKFVPVLKDKNYVHCEVLLPQITKDKKYQELNVGETLLKIGFGQVEVIDRPLSESPKYLVYYNRLKAAEAYAIRKQLGLKYYLTVPVTMAMFTHKKVQELIPVITKQMPKLYKTLTS